MKRWLMVMGTIALAKEIFALSVGGDLCVFLPEGGLPSLEFAGKQEILLPWGFFLEGGGMYYRLLGLGYEYDGRIWGMFSGDMLALVTGCGWQMQWKRWHGNVCGYVGVGGVFSGELREVVAREFLSMMEEKEALVVKSGLKSGLVMGGGVSFETGYQWKRVSLGLVGGYLWWYGRVPLDLEWTELDGETLTIKRNVFDGAFFLRGMRLGVMFQVMI